MPLELLELELEDELELLDELLEDELDDELLDDELLLDPLLEPPQAVNTAMPRATPASRVVRHVIDSVFMPDLLSLLFGNLQGIFKLGHEQDSPATCRHALPLTTEASGNKVHWTMSISAGF